MRLPSEARMQAGMPGQVRSPTPPTTYPLRVRRVYRMARGRWDACEDCGRIRPRTIIVWWASGGRYRVCGECIAPYRGVILGPAHAHTIAANRPDVEYHV